MPNASATSCGRCWTPGPRHWQRPVTTCGPALQRAEADLDQARAELARLTADDPAEEQTASHAAPRRGRQKAAPASSQDTARSARGPGRGGVPQF